MDGDSNFQIGIWQTTNFEIAIAAAPCVGKWESNSIANFSRGRAYINTVETGYKIAISLKVNNYKFTLISKPTPDQNFVMGSLLEVWAKSFTDKFNLL